MRGRFVAGGVGQVPATTDAAPGVNADVPAGGGRVGATGSGTKEHVDVMVQNLEGRRGVGQNKMRM